MEIKNKTPIHISSYSSDKEKKEIEEIFSSLNPDVDKTIITKGIEQQLLQIIIDLSQIDIKHIIYGGIIYDLLKSAITRLYREVKTKKPTLKLKYNNKIIFHDSDENIYLMFVKDKTKANFRNDFYKNKSLKEMLKLIEAESKEERRRNKMECFTVYADEIEGRIDPYFYRPEFVELEEKVAKKTNKKLNDFIISISSGATPSRKKDEELYTDETNGMPFLRVQNITENGLVLDDVKFITKEVHNTELKRSQVKEYNLLITITGRIASSCVVPKGFEGNINQHSVVIETKDRKTAEIIAVFLNSKIGHNLALRRTSGGSRPALDYTALKSIPIILNEKIVSLMDNAYKIKKQKEVEVKQLLDSINDYVLDELEIKLPELKDKICYVVYSDDVKNNRIDAYYYQPKFEEVEKAVKKGKFEVKELKEFITKIHYGASVKNEYIDEGIPFLRIMNLKPNKFDLRDVVKLPESMRKDLGTAYVSEGDLLISRSGTVGVVSVVPKEAEGFAFGSFMIKFCLNDKINKYYVSAWLNTKLQKLLTEREKIGAIQGNITIETIENFKIPLPPLNIQNKIAEEVKRRMQKAEQLQKEAKEELENAKAEVEKIILGDEKSNNAD